MTVIELRLVQYGVECGHRKRLCDAVLRWLEANEVLQPMGRSALWQRMRAGTQGRIDVHLFGVARRFPFVDLDRVAEHVEACLARRLAPELEVMPANLIDDQFGPPPKGHHSPGAQPGGHHCPGPVPRGFAALPPLQGVQAPVRLAGSFTRAVRTSFASVQPPSTQSCFSDRMCSSAVDGDL